MARAEGRITQEQGTRISGRHIAHGPLSSDLPAAETSGGRPLDSEGNSQRYLPQFLSRFETLTVFMQQQKLQAKDYFLYDMRAFHSVVPSLLPALNTPEYQAGQAHATFLRASEYYCFINCLYYNSLSIDILLFLNIY